MSNMNESTLLFVDSGIVAMPNSANVDRANYISDVLKDSSDKVRLRVSIRATHSGQLIRGRCYTGWGMKAGYKSWFKKDSGGSAAFNKPVLINHDMEHDPLGRVVSAEFTQLKFGKAWEEDWINPDTGLDLGSGFITLDADITDPDAITKISDGRYDTVSTTQSAKDAWCSFCRTSVKVGCDHEIDTYVKDDNGVEYLVYAVTGEKTYHEVSYVNHPRQQNAKTLSFKQMKDSLAQKNMIWDSQISYAYQALKIGTEDPSTLVDLLCDSLPSVGKTTGKKVVSMSKKLDKAPPGPALPDGVTKPSEGVTSDKSEAAKEVPAKPETPVVKDFKFANMALALKDVLDLAGDYKDSLYFYGITDSSDGHAHAFTCYYKLKDKVLSGYTTTTGQGEPDQPHGHSIWNEFSEAPVEGVEGDTRDADRGPSHTHDFYASMSGGMDSADKLIATTEEISGAIADLEKAISDGVLKDDEKNALLIKDVEAQYKLTWDEEYCKAAIRLLPRILNRDVQIRVIQKLADVGHLKRETMPINETIETAIKLLNDTLASTQKKLADAEAKIADYEAKLAKSVSDHETALKAAKDSGNAEIGKLVVALRSVAEGKSVDFSKITADSKDSDPAVVKAEIEKLVTDLPTKLKTTVKSLTQDAKKDSSPTALNDKTNQVDKTKKNKSESSDSQMSHKRLDELVN